MTKMTASYYDTGKEINHPNSIMKNALNDVLIYCHLEKIRMANCPSGIDC